MNKGKSWTTRADLKITAVMMILGTVSLVISVLDNSMILALIGLGLAFWGALLLYITPSKHVPLELLTATTSSMNDIERILNDSRLAAKGVYLPPKRLRDSESSLIFVPADAKQALPSPEDADETRMALKSPSGMLFTPPGAALSKLFEKKLGTSFIKTNVKTLQEKLPGLFIEDLEIAQDLKITAEGPIISVEITDHVFKDLCEETEKLKRLHESMGCILTSAIACALAKATGKPLTIEGEEQSQDGKTTTIRYRTMEE
jgi:hypothetical protein